jgi:pimeloyl-ACP methyl ester carboxylesterase
MTAGERTLTRDGVRLHVEDTGGAGLPVVFQHGLCGDAAQTAEVFPPGFRRLTLECRGHGRSEAGPFERFAVAAFASDVAAILEEFDEPVVVGGISMGAAIALRLAVRRPERVRALILARPAWVTENAPPNMAPNAEVGRLLATSTPETARAAFLAGATAARLAAAAPDNLATLTGMFAREPVEVTAALLQRISIDGPGVSEQEARALNVPTLVIATRQDSIHPLAHAETLAAMIPAARLAVIASKSTDRAAYVREFRAALAAFLMDLR